MSGQAGDQPAWMHYLCHKEHEDWVDKLTMNQQHAFHAMKANWCVLLARAYPVSGGKVYEKRLKELGSFGVEKRGQKRDLTAFPST